jgi:hypothetical protein
MVDLTCIVKLHAKADGHIELKDRLNKGSIEKAIDKK